MEIALWVLRIFLILLPIVEPNFFKKEGTYPPEKQFGWRKKERMMYRKFSPS